MISIYYFAGVSFLYKRHIYKLKHLLRYSRRWDGFHLWITRLQLALFRLDFVQYFSHCSVNLLEKNWGRIVIHVSDTVMTKFRWCGRGFYSVILVRNSCLPELALLLSYRVFGGGGGFFPFPFTNAVRTLRIWCSKIHKLSRSGFSGAMKDDN